MIICYSLHDKHFVHLFNHLCSALLTVWRVVIEQCVTVV